LKVYDIEYNFERKTEFDDEEEYPQIPGALKGEFQDINKIEDDDGNYKDFENIEIINMHMQIGSMDFQSATMEAIDMLDDAFGDEEGEYFYEYKVFPEGYEILGVVEVQGLNILNWPGEGNPCDCPQCQARDMAEEDVMVFNCPNCGNEIRVPIDSWNLVLCRKCECQILRSGVISLGNNKYTYLKLEEKENKEGG